MDIQMNELHNIGIRDTIDTPLINYSLWKLKYLEVYTNSLNFFLHSCANATWSFKGPKGLHISILVIFLCQGILITLQRM
jgi:hypothetical protein